MNPHLSTALADLDLPRINAALNFLSTIFLLTGFLLIKMGRRKAHQYVMTAALASSAVFLASYLTYHYTAGHTVFPTEYPVARKVYLAILVPHIILAVVNLPLIVVVVVSAARGRFETHKRFAKFTYPSWLFVSVTGVVIYFMIYQWFPPTVSASSEDTPPAPAGVEGDAVAAKGPVVSLAGTRRNNAAERLDAYGARGNAGDLVFTPLSRTIKAEAGDTAVEVTFGVENTGAQPVRIAKLESGCECLSVEIDVNPVPPRGKAVITGLFDVTKLRGSSERKITVVSEGESRPVLLTTRIEIDPLYEIEAPMTTWAVGSEPDKKVVVFRVLREAPLHVLAAESKRPEVACEIVEVEKGRLYHLELTPASTEKSLLGIVRIETDCEIEEYARPLVYFSIQ